MVFDGRALARASERNWPGTAEGLQAFLSWLTGHTFAGRDALETTRRVWLPRRGPAKPFDDTVRARLRNE